MGILFTDQFKKFLIDRILSKITPKIFNGPFLTKSLFGTNTVVPNSTSGPSRIPLEFGPPLEFGKGREVFAKKLV